MQKKGEKVPQPLSRMKQYMVGFGLILFSLIFAIAIIFYLAIRPQTQAFNQAKSVAMTYGHLQQITKVEAYRGQETIYSVYGKNEANQEAVALVSDQGGQVEVYPLSQGISQSKAEEIAKAEGLDKIDKAVLGRYQSKTIWEIQSGMTYYLIDFLTGDIIKKEDL